jgi:hypothetical protein
LLQKSKSEQALFQGSFARHLISNQIISTPRHGIVLPTVASLVLTGKSWAKSPFCLQKIEKQLLAFGFSRQLKAKCFRKLQCHLEEDSHN